jgi:hypothetical protein
MPDRWYRVFFSDDLTDWDPLSSDILGTGVTQIINDTTTNPARFYRVEVRLVTP